MNDRNNNREFNRNFFILLYPDCEEHVKALDFIKITYENYAFILHDKDVVSEFDNLKKEHWHVVVQFKNKRFRSTIAKEINVSENYIEGCNIDSSLLYLIHYDNPDKYQYSIDEVFGTLHNRLKKLINSRGKDENDRVCELIEYITTATSSLSVTEFARYCACNGYWDVYRRGAYIFNQILKEHNYSLGILLNKQGFEKMSDEMIEKYFMKGIENSET